MRGTVAKKLRKEAFEFTAKTTPQLYREVYKKLKKAYKEVGNEFHLHLRKTW